MMKLGLLVKKAADALFPYIPRCVGCGIEKGVDGFLCGKCKDTLDNQRLGRTAALQYDAVSVYHYDGIAKHIVRSFKYGGGKWLSAFMADEMAKALTNNHIQAECICCVPLHPKRRSIRGFDQAEELAKAVAQKTDISFINAIQRVKNTKTQTKLNQAQRKVNMLGAFESIAHVHGNVVLVDDVLTTGATAAECAAQLVRAGAQHVIVLTFARAVFTQEVKPKFKIWFARR